MEPEFERFLKSLQEPLTPISSQLFLGNRQAALDLALLRENRISAVVQIQDNTTTAFHGDALAYHCIALVDSPQSNLLEYLPAAMRFVHTHLSAGRNVLIHCDAGVSRSASVVLAYLMAACNFSFDEAHAFVKKKRACICPNRGFEQQLKSVSRETLDSWISA